MIKGKGSFKINIVSYLLYNFLCALDKIYQTSFNHIIKSECAVLYHNIVGTCRHLEIHLVMLEAWHIFIIQDNNIL